MSVGLLCSKCFRTNVNVPRLLQKQNMFDGCSKARREIICKAASNNLLKISENCCAITEMMFRPTYLWCLLRSLKWQNIKSNLHFDDFIFCRHYFSTLLSITSNNREVSMQSWSFPIVNRLLNKVHCLGWMLMLEIFFNSSFSLSPLVK